MAPLQSSRYSKEYEDARVAVFEGRIDNALAIGAYLLNDPELPRYYRINTLILLASVSTDWIKTENLRVRAEHVWKESRDLYDEGADTATDAALAELRTLLDRLKTEQAKAVPPNYEDTLSAQLAETKIENLADFAEGAMEALADVEYENEQSARSESMALHAEDGFGVTLEDTPSMNLEGRCRGGFFSSYTGPYAVQLDPFGVRAAEQIRDDDSNGGTFPLASTLPASTTQAPDGISVAGPSGMDSVNQGQNGHSDTPVFAPASTLPASINLLNNKGVSLGHSNTSTHTPGTTAQASNDHDQNGHSDTPGFNPASTLPASLDLLEIQDRETGPCAPNRLSRDGQTAGSRMMHRKHGFTRSYA